ncbi:enoyl-CoA hydratase [Papillibacter cinnamivorans DSM 12816]|uniref:short-chain-enoyl-CoA hydratase n=2 Tax=Papillibacter TaxID=100175 RepID=A0A1W1YP97_9FIRM|nr:enoyl-CoA hydratase-related protein [Papillibacter cinnamivorans]SMC37963.1 enoyl-CoA hydratase [Papillibacter cinnamivorans DSM 12816]
MSYITFEQKNHIVLLTVNRPEALNALCKEVILELDAAIARLEEMDDVSVVILTGAGRAFVAGADIAEMKDLPVPVARDWSALGNRVFRRLETLPKIVIAAVGGFALGGGCELAMSCDIRIASEKAKFGQPEVGLGITPGFGGTQRLPRIVGVGRAMELIATGRVVGAEEAERIGLVNRVVAPEALMDETFRLAETICAQAQIAVRQSKRCIRQGMQADIVTAAAFESEAFGLCFSTEDQKEGMSAFVEKRAEKNFKNR